MHVGLIGAGDFGAHHAKAIAQLDGVRLSAACRTNGAALARFTERHGGTPYTDYRDLLNDKRVDAVVVATPHHVHTDIAVAAAAAGKQILLEKPMAPTLTECDRILDAVDAAGVELMVGHISRFVPAYRAAKDLLLSGDLGTVVAAHSTMTRPWMTPNRQPWHLDRGSGGGIWLTIGVHLIDQLNWLIDAPVTGVSATLDTRFHEQDADDVAVVLLHYANRVIATASCIGYRTGVFNFVTELNCTGGSLRIDHRAGVAVGREEIWQPVANSASENWMAEALLGEWRAFAAALRQGSAMPVSGSEARHVMQVALAAEESSRRRCEIGIESTDG